MVLFCDSFAYGDPDHICGRIPAVGFLDSCKYVNYSSAGSVNSIASAPGGAKALKFNNSSFNQQTLTKMLGTRTAACAGILYRANGSDIGNFGSVILRYEDGATIVNPGGGGSGHDGGNTTSVLTLQVRQADRTLTVSSGQYGTSFDPGTVLWNSAGAFTVSFNTWYFLELQVDTGTGTWALYVDDVLLQNGFFGFPPNIDRISTRSESFEVHDVANFYVTDGDRLGPVRVIGFPPNFGSTHQWAPLVAPNLSQVQEFGNRVGKNTPDDNQSYVEATTAGVTDYYGFPAPACFGRILALALNVDASAVAGSPSVDWLIRQTGLDTNLGGSAALIGGYTIQQGISMLNPVTGTFWTDADIAAALFGFSFAGSGDARVTQFMLEKVVSLRNVPFDCGFGSYSFTS